MESIQLANLEFEPTHIYITLKPRADWDQTEPHVYCAFELGQTVGGVFSPLYKSEMTLKAADFVAFVTEFQDLKSRFVDVMLALGKIATADGK